MLDQTTEIITVAEIDLTAGGLHDALRRVRHAMCREETRYYLNGVYMHHVGSDRALRFVATDGHRLAMADIRTPDGAETMRPVILSRAFVGDAIKRINKRRDAFRHVRLSLGPEHADLTCWDGTVVDGPLVDGTFPDYERVIPRGEPQHGTATIAREPLMRAIAGLTEFAKASSAKWPVSPTLRFAFAAGNLTVSAVMQDSGAACRGSASVAVDVAASTMKQPGTVGFYGPNVLDILNSLQGQHVQFEFFDVGGPNRFVGDNADSSALHVIMPVRIT
jgi:DNA polymerase III subunit beta